MSNDTDFKTYEELLDKAYEQLPETIFEETRFKVPKGYSVIQGSRTVIKNFGDIASTLNRDPQHVLKYLLRELGTSGNVEGNRAILQGKFTHYLINDRISDYVDNFVMCHECNRPDTVIIRDDRIDMLKCMACGARAPLKSL